MQENTITITLEEYRSLVRAEERIAAVERMLTTGNYVSTEDIKPVLGITEARDEGGKGDASV